MWGGGGGGGGKIYLSSCTLDWHAFTLTQLSNPVIPSVLIFSYLLALPNPSVQLIPHVLYWGQIKSVRYRDEILRPVAVPLVHQRNLILQQDNARPHVARVCQDFLANNDIAPLAWAPYSPDLTPIEHMWDELDRRVRKRRNPPRNSRTTKECVDR